MANDNETVEQACESICELVIAIHDKEHNEKQEIKNACHIVQQVKDRIIDAHKREIADEKRISDAVVQSLRDKKLEMAGEIAAKDAEIERCRDELRATRERRDVCEPKMRTALERVTHAESKCDALRALVKKLADKLQSSYICVDGESHFDSCDIKDLCPSTGACALVAMARKMIGGAK